MLRLWKSSRKAASAVAPAFLETNPNLSVQQSRAVRILKRRYPPRLHKKDATYFPIRKNDFYYDFVEDTDIKKKPNIEVILTEDVDGFGLKGDKISLKRLMAYNHFLLTGLAVYATPENIEKHMNKETKVERKYNSKYVLETIKVLERFCLTVNMNVQNSWKLEKWHIQVNFRLSGIYMSEDSITLPKQDIFGPNLQNEAKEFYVTITINEKDKVKVRCRLHHVTSIPEYQLPEGPEFWKNSNGPLFLEDKEVLDALPRPKWEDCHIKEQTF